MVVCDSVSTAAPAATFWHPYRATTSPGPTRERSWPVAATRVHTTRTHGNRAGNARTRGFTQGLEVIGTASPSSCAGECRWLDAMHLDRARPDDRATGRATTGKIIVNNAVFWVNSSMVHFPQRPVQRFSGSSAGL